MNELKRTQRITIAILVLLGLILIGFMVRKKPDMPYKMSTLEAADQLSSVKQITPLQAQKMIKDTTKYIFIDLRSPYDFVVSHVDNAINIPITFLLDKENRDLFTNWKATGKTVILYAQDELKAVSPWLLLQELGYTNVKYLRGGYQHLNDNTKRYMTERAKFDYAKIASGGAQQAGDVSQTQTPKPKKKAIPVKKKVKKEAEGGC